MQCEIHSTGSWRLDSATEKVSLDMSYARRITLEPLFDCGKLDVAGGIIAKSTFGFTLNPSRRCPDRQTYHPRLYSPMNTPVVANGLTALHAFI